MSTTWRKCSTCKEDIGIGQRYYVCSVSTCQGKITNYVFCSVECWDAHLPIERHRPDSAGAIERTAPRDPTATLAASTAQSPQRIVPKSQPVKPQVDDEVLVVVTKVRKYIADRSGLNTSAEVYEALTDRIKRLCDGAIEHARGDGRKTVMERDFVG